MSERAPGLPRPHERNNNDNNIDGNARSAIQKIDWDLPILKFIDWRIHCLTQKSLHVSVLSGSRGS